MPTPKELGGRLFQPSRPQLEACLRVVRQDMSGASAWRALNEAGVIPDRWVGGDQRLFDPAADNNLRVSSSGEPDPRPASCPPTPAACVAIASCDLTTVETAEHAALQIFDAASIWQSPLDKQKHERPTACVWELLPIGGVVRARKIQMVQGSLVTALDAAMLAVEEHDRALFQQTAADIGRLEAETAKLVENRTGLRISQSSRLRWWVLARELNLVVPGQLRRDHGLGRMPKTLRGKRFVELPDFSEDLAAVMYSGFATGIHGPTCFMFGVRPAWETLPTLGAQ